MSKTVTAEELMERLNRNPAYQEKMRRNAERREANTREFLAAVAPLMNDLRRAGVGEATPREMVEKHAPLDALKVEILLRHLPTLTLERAQEQVVRVLAAAAGPFTGRPLKAAFESTESDGLRWAIANTVACVQVTGVDAWVAELRRNPEYARMMKRPID